MNFKDESKEEIMLQKEKVASMPEGFSLSVKQLRELAGFSIFMASKVMEEEELNEFTTHLMMFLALFKDKESYESHKVFLDNAFFDLDIENYGVYAHVPGDMESAVSRAAFNALETSRERSTNKENLN